MRQYCGGAGAKAHSRTQFVCACVHMYMYVWRARAGSTARPLRGCDPRWTRGRAAARAGDRSVYELLTSTCAVARASPRSVNTRAHHPREQTRRWADLDDQDGDAEPEVVLVVDVANKVRHLDVIDDDGDEGAEGRRVRVHAGDQHVQRLVLALPGVVCVGPERDAWRGRRGQGQGRVRAGAPGGEVGRYIGAAATRCVRGGTCGECVGVRRRQEEEE